MQVRIVGDGGRRRAPDRLGDYLRDFRKLLDRYDYGSASLYGHFGQGCVHTRIPFDLTTAAGIAKYRSFVTDGAQLVVDYGGSLSGEHGDGQSRGELLPIMFGERVVTAFEKTKALFDPDNRMNPGKVVHPYPLDSNLHLGADYRPAEPSTYFSYAEEDHRFSRAANRCVGVGKCRGDESAVMCPSYRATREVPPRFTALHEVITPDIGAQIDDIIPNLGRAPVVAYQVVGRLTDEQTGVALAGVTGYIVDLEAAPPPQQITTQRSSEDGLFIIPFPREKSSSPLRVTRVLSRTEDVAATPNATRLTKRNPP